MTVKPRVFYETPTKQAVRPGMMCYENRTNTLKPKLAAFTISALLAGLCGGFFAFYHISYYHSYPFSPFWTFDAMFITYVGGVGTIVGPALGAVFFVLVREQLALAITAGEMHLMIFGALFIVVVLILRKGLFEPVEKIFRSFVRKQHSN